MKGGIGVLDCAIVDGADDNLLTMMKNRVCHGVGDGGISGDDDNDDYSQYKPSSNLHSVDVNILGVGQLVVHMHGGHQ